MKLFKRTRGIINYFSIFFNLKKVIRDFLNKFLNNAKKLLTSLPEILNFYEISIYNIDLCIIEDSSKVMEIILNQIADNSQII